MSDTTDFFEFTDDLDLSHLEDKQFIVGINTGDRQQAGIIAESISGPYNFAEMVAAVALKWTKNTEHAKVFTLNGPDQLADWLDEQTCQYIEIRSTDILFELAMRDDKERKVPDGEVST